MRALTSPQTAALAARTVIGVLFVQMNLDVVQYWCSANTSLEWNGHTWVGIGQIASVGEVEESAALEIKTLQLGISGVPVEIIALVEAQPIQGRLCQVWFGTYDPVTYQLIDTPALEYSGKVDTPSNREHPMDAQGAIICDLTVTVESRFAFGLRPRVSRRTDAEQQRLYPIAASTGLPDTGMRFVNKMTNVTLVGWGRG